MSGVNYGPLIDDMTWSYSRLKSFEACPYGWYLRYIRKFPSDENRFYASYGKFMHQLLEAYYRGELTPSQMLVKYYRDFQSEVVGRRPKESTLQKYIQGGADYLKSFRPLPYNMIAVEDKIEMTLDGFPFVMIIDYLGEKDGDLYLIDNKSRALKPRSNRPKPTLADKELDSMLRQLYVYSDGIKQKYGKYPKYLGFNCFRSNELILEPFNEKAHDEALQWVKDTIAEIKATSEFEAKPNAFACYWLCGVLRLCEPYHEQVEERRLKKS